MISVPLIIGGFGPIELGIILIILVLLFGANRLPDLARSAGLSIGEFEKGRREIEAELDDDRDDTPEQAADAEGDVDVVKADE